VSPPLSRALGRRPGLVWLARTGLGSPDSESRG